MKNKTTMEKFEVKFPNKPIIGMIHTNSDSEMSVLDIAKMEIDIYLKYGINTM